MLYDAGYLGDDWYLRKDMIGKIRYFYVKGDNPEGIVWGATKAEVVERAGLVLKPDDAEAGMTVYDYVKSFSVYTGTAAGNRELVNATRGQSVANLHAVGGTQRQVVGEAYFGPIDNEEINVNRQMIHQLWENPVNDDENMYATMDIASGKDDSAPMIIWRGLQMIDIDYFKGDANNLADWIKSRLTRYNVPITNFVYDSTGHGYWVQALTNGIGVTSNRRAVQEYDEYGNPTSTHNEFFNLRSQMLGKLEVMLKRGEISCIIPKDKLVPFGKNNELRRFYDVLCDGVDLFRISEKNGKTYYHTKEEFKSRYKYSPGELDSIALRTYLEFDTRERKQPKPQVPQNAYYGFYHRPKVAGVYGRYR